MQDSKCDSIYVRYSRFFTRRDTSGSGRLWQPTLTPLAIGLESTAVFLLAWVFFALSILPSDTVFTVDGFYHFRIMEQIWSDGPWVDIRWLPLTMLGEEGPDHHWLWHLIFSPFGMMEDRVLGLKLALITNGAMVPAIFNITCRLLGVPLAPLWSLLLLAAGLTFPARILMLRAQNIAICYLLLTVLFAMRRSYLLLGIIVFIAIQSYHGSVIIALPILLVLFVLAVREKRFDGKLLIFSSAGLLFGLVLSPWFPQNVDFLIFHLLFVGVNSLVISSASEWVPMTLSGLWRHAWPAHLLWGVSLIALVGFRGALVRQAPVVVSNLLALAMLLAYASANRFAEYYIPTALLAAAVNSVPMLGMMKRYATLLIVVSMVVFAGWRIAENMEVYRQAAIFRFTHFGEIAEMLEQRAEPDSLIFNTGEDFSFLLGHSAKFRYVVGLSPNFLAYQDRGRYLLWSAILGPQPLSQDEGKVILEAFGCRWVVVKRSAKALYNKLLNSPYASLELTTDSGYLFSLQEPSFRGGRE